MSSESTNAPSAQPDAIAVIGMACRFPGAANYDQFWSNLTQGVASVAEIPAMRWDRERYYSPDQDHPDTSVSKWGGFIDDVDRFDAAFFKISRREAELMDPQQRILLELAWSCFEDAGYAPSRLRASAVGVYIGVCNFDYKEVLEKQPAPIEGHLSTGTYGTLIANRISYEFDLRGPSMPIDTACSSSLVALHEAVHALRRGDCSTALVGGVSVLCSPTYYVAFSKTGMLSPDGACKTFDAGANGYVRGEGAGLIMLKPLAQALADGDRVLGLIRSTAINHGGKVQTLTSPSPFAQAKVIVDAWQRAGVAPNSISFIEAHGTGTPKGDPIEINALKRAFSTLEKAAGDKLLPRSCALGTAKTHIGHLEAAAGIAGIIKTLMSMRHRTLPGLLHFERLNPRINLENSPFYVLEKTQPWSAADAAAPLRAGVSSFGFGGVNAHAVLEQYQGEVLAPAMPAPPVRAPFLLSARSGERLAAYAGLTAQYLRTHPELSLGEVVAASQRREAMDERLAVFADSVADLAERLDAMAAPAADLLRGSVADGRATIAPYLEQGERRTELETWIRQGAGAELALLWVHGLALDWPTIFPAPAGWARLPSYPFADKRYWFPQPAGSTSADAEAAVSVVPEWGHAVSLQRADAHQARAASAGALVVSVWPAGARVAAALTVLPAERHLILHAPHGAGAAQDWIAVVQQALAALRPAIAQQKPRRCVLLAQTGCGLGRMMEVALRSIEKEIALPLASYALADVINADGAMWQSVLTHAGAGHPAGSGFQLCVAGGALVACARRWVCVDLPAPLPLARGAVVWITGGSGALARMVAGMLTEKYGATVILSARSFADEPFGQAAGEGRIVLRKADCTDIGQMTHTCEWIVRTFGRLNGVIHAAGTLRDKSVFAKSAADIEAVLGPKISGALVLDQVTRTCQLDYFAVFSSASGVFGNAGQADYAAANAYLHHFAAGRRGQAAAGQRSGASVAIDWPFWKEGGMRIGPDQIAALAASMGTSPLPTAAGLAACEILLGGAHGDTCVMYGGRNAIEAALNRTAQPVLSTPAAVAPAAPGQPAPLPATAAELEQELKSLLAELTRTDVHELSRTDHFNDLGLDSILLQSFVKRSNARYGLALPLVQFHSHPTVAELAAFMLGSDLAGSPPRVVAPAPAAADVFAAAATQSGGDIAVVGISIKVAGASTLDQFWDLVSGPARKAVAYPAERWAALPPQMRAASSREACSGLFLDAIDAFDHQLFHLSPREAMLMDPQQRLLMHSVWEAIEHAGYTRQQFARRTTAVLVSVDAVDYEEAVRCDPQVDEFTAAGSARYLAANRLSHFFDLQGISEPVSTACSSVFVAVGRALDALRRGQCEQALVAGVQLNIAPSRFRMLEEKGLLSQTGNTRPFDGRADGFVRGEGVGTLVLKRLDCARKDGDHIHGVIKGSGVWHGGKAMSATAPNAGAHEQAMMLALADSGVTAAQLAYVEGHGTGMPLGDASEVAALGKVIGEGHTCQLGGAKSTLGHLEAASGIAALVKVLLALEKGRAPGLPGWSGATEIDFGRMRPSADEQVLAVQPGDAPPLAGLHAYGLGGVSTFVVVQGAAAPVLPTTAPAQEAAHPGLFVLSARSQEVLIAYLKRVASLLTHAKENHQAIDFACLLQTYQTRREHMQQRVAIVAADADELRIRIGQYLRGERCACIYASDTEVGRRSNDQPDGAGLAAIVDWHAVAARWVGGSTIAWQDGCSRRQPFPTYPFSLARRFWPNTGEQ